jgi:hypothetical protein
MMQDILKICINIIEGSAGLASERGVIGKKTLYPATWPPTKE